MIDFIKLFESCCNSSLNVKKDYDTCDIVDDTLFTPPCLVRYPYQCLCGLLRVSLLEVGIDNIGHFLVR